MQCKDVDDLPILQFLADRQGRWCSWCNGLDNDVAQAMPEGLNPKLVLGKMRMLIRRELVDGCPCGCRGDFEITAKGMEYLHHTSSGSGTGSSAVA